MSAATMVTDAVLPDDGVYRYQLTRRWGAGSHHALFVMLNPSTADATTDDPTIRRCIGFAQREGCDGLRVVNLYGFRATKPADLWRADDPIGPDNDHWISVSVAIANQTDSPIIAAWGAHAKPHHVYKIKSLPGMKHAKALAFTKAGAPGHPLYIPGDAPLLPLTPTQGAPHVR